MWDKISKELNAMGYHVTNKQYSTMLASLKTKYKNINNHNLKTRSDRKTWIDLNVCALNVLL